MTFYRKIWCFALKSKDQVFDMFNDFHSKLDRETGKQLKCVRANNGGENKGSFESYCKFYGIRREKTVLKTLQENGVTKRMNKSITKRVRCMFSNAKLPKSYWGETMRTTIDLINLFPLIHLNSDILERV